MKKYLLIFLVLLPMLVAAQTPQADILWLKGIGGDGGDQVFKNVTSTNDGGFIVGIGTNAAYGTGNIDSYCVLSGERSIFVKYNSDATIQEWKKCFLVNGDTGLSYIYPTNDGGVVLSGRYTSSGMYICKQDDIGNIVWSHGYSKGSSLSLTCMMATAEGGYIMGGGSHYVDTNVLIHYGSWTSSDMFIIKVDSLGNKVWTRVLGGTDHEFVRQILAAPDKGYYIVGQTESDNNDCIGNHGSVDGFVARLDSNGNIIWSKCYGGSLYDGFSCAIPNGYGGVLACGSTVSNNGDVTHHLGAGTNFWLVNINSNGYIIWDSCYGGGSECYPNSVCKAADGSIWMAGVSRSGYGHVDTAYGLDDAWFVHTDSIGHLINVKVLGSSNEDRGMMIFPLSNGYVIGGGFFQAQDGAFSSAGFFGGFDAFLLNFAPWTTNIDETYLNNSVKVYPNPVDDQLYIKFEKSGNYSVAVTDVIGKVILKIFSANSVQLDTSKWKKGMYCLRIVSDEGNVQLHKFIVQ